MGDGNNAYFYANRKLKNKHIRLTELEDVHGNLLIDPQDIEKEILRFYKALDGEASSTLTEVDITVMRKGAQLTREKKD